ncbi:hypothetical protein BZA05DRAFT_53032 [Tricharina praecox]|uniref:uncharacterized protein n=1 Tax=Tricharina praecox TaxID=43433 RepID=UPI00221F59AC|nr:uncharacterized protein BZA05DRAFT_53032 [Tricharina praecox]KAI5850919.1 hypothetical protein BZA05DRAFT_53032 [Tricharina praecox]
MHSLLTASLIFLFCAYFYFYFLKSLARTAHVTIWSTSGVFIWFHLVYLVLLFFSYIWGVHMGHWGEHRHNGRTVMASGGKGLGGGGGSNTTSTRLGRGGSVWQDSGKGKDWTWRTIGGSVLGWVDGIRIRLRRWTMDVRF